MAESLPKIDNTDLNDSVGQLIKRQDITNTSLLSIKDILEKNLVIEKKSLDASSFSLQISKPKVKKLLIEETNMAIEKGVFGVPSFIINDNLFWGNDQMEHIELLLAGNDPLDNEKLNIYLDRPRAVDRWIIKNRRPLNGKKK